MAVSARRIRFDLSSDVEPDPPRWRPRGDTGGPAPAGGTGPAGPEATCESGDLRGAYNCVLGPVRTTLPT
ncbi:hypothetical protein B8X04_06475 [Brevibacterium casei]|uniref:Uncharacterized protein n=1 Tax=Brevibacterium casei TaxID=33889 RepID=A0A269ZDK9_9MICO|nr:hypothetical protein B8X04_06475 [Brevibacterium casei]